MWADGRALRWMKKRSPWRPLVASCWNLWLILGLIMLLAYCLVMKSRSYNRDEEQLVSLKNHHIHGRSLVTKTHDDTSLPLCPPTPTNLKGRQDVNETVTLNDAEAKVTGVKEGGFWWPSHCHPRWRVAIIVPYRDRLSQMGPFMYHMHNFLQRQELNYSIYIVEQEGDDLFNRARLLNVGYLEAQKEGPWDCVAFHDVDMLPEDDHHLYHCSQQPRHLAVGTSNHDYQLVYYRYFGGACLMTKEQVELVNGWSNVYWGWGGEDDDMWRRIDFTDMKVWRYSRQVARYKTIRHKRQILNEHRYKTLTRNTGRYPYDGLNTLKYEVRTINRKSLFTHILTYIGSSQETTNFTKPTAKRDERLSQDTNLVSDTDPEKRS